VTYSFLGTTKKYRGAKLTTASAEKQKPYWKGVLKAAVLVAT
jgi:hypothetical protein